MYSGQKLGELNGVWALALKICLAAFPVALTAAITVSAYVINKGFDHDARLAAIEQTRFTLKDANDLEQRIQAQREQATTRLESKIDRLTDKVDALGARAR